MPAKSPRITITLDQDDYDVLNDLAKLQGVPMSRIIREFVREAGPVLRQLKDTLEAAQRAELSAAIRFREAAEKAEQDLRPLAQMMQDQFDLFAEQAQAVLNAATEEDPEEQTRRRA